MFRRSANKMNACITGIFISLFSSFLLFVAAAAASTTTATTTTRTTVASMVCWSVDRSLLVCHILSEIYFFDFVSCPWFHDNRWKLCSTKEWIWLSKTDSKSKNMHKIFGSRSYRVKPFKLHISIVAGMCLSSASLRLLQNVVHILFYLFICFLFFAAFFVFHHFNSIFGWVRFRTIL